MLAMSIITSVIIGVSAVVGGSVGVRVCGSGKQIGSPGPSGFRLLMRLVVGEFE